MTEQEDTLLDIAKADLWVADSLIAVLTGDEIQINLIAYHIQQALEKAIKFQLSNKGVEYRFGHDLNLLISLDKELRRGMPSDLREELGVITTWEASTRYVLGYRTELEFIKEILVLVKAYINDVSNSFNKMQLSLGDSIKQTQEFV